jgi:hypothetical protein
MSVANRQFSRMLCVLAVVMPIRAGATEGEAPPTTKSASFFDMSAKAWCVDPATLCFPNHGDLLPGIRLVADSAIGGTYSTRLRSETLSARAGVELSIWGSWIAAQLLVLSPTSIEIQNSSRYLLQTPSNNKVDVLFGVGTGFSLFDGAIGVGYASLYLDPNQFPRRSGDSPGVGVFYLNLQPFGLLRSVGKRARIADGTINL